MYNFKRRGATVRIFRFMAILLAGVIFCGSAAWAQVCDPKAQNCTTKECAVANIGQTTLENDRTDIIACLADGSSSTGARWKSMYMGIQECQTGLIHSTGICPNKVVNITPLKDENGKVADINTFQAGIYSVNGFFCGLPKITTAFPDLMSTIYASTRKGWNCVMDSSGVCLTFSGAEVRAINLAPTTKAIDATDPITLSDGRTLPAGTTLSALQAEAGTTRWAGAPYKLFTYGPALLLGNRWFMGAVCADGWKRTACSLANAYADEDLSMLQNGCVSDNEEAARGDMFITCCK